MGLGSRRTYSPRRGRERQQAPETLDSLPEFNSQPRDSPHLPLFRPVQSLSGTSATTPNHSLSQLDYTSHTASESLSSENLDLRVLFSEALRITFLNSPRLPPTTIPIMLHAAQDAASALGPLPFGDVVPLCWARGGRSET